MANRDVIRYQPDKLDWDIRNTKLRSRKNSNLTNEVLNFPFYPTNVMLCQLAEAAYQHNVKHVPEEWELLAQAKNKDDGYLGAAFWHDKNRHLVICHRIDCSPSVLKDFEETFIFSQNTQLHLGCTFIFLILNNLRENYSSISITGHSLGGWLAQITAFAIEYLKLEGNHFRALVKEEQKYHPHTVTFDNPGSRNFLENLSLNYFHTVTANKLISKLDMTTYLIPLRRINSATRYLGRLLRVESLEETDSDRPGFYLGKWLTSKILKHDKLDHFLKAFAENRTILEIFDWTMNEPTKEEFSDEKEYNRENLDDGHFFSGKPVMEMRLKFQPYDQYIPTNIFKEDELKFLENWRKLKANKFLELTELFSANKLGSFDDFLPEFEILNDYIICKSRKELERVVNRSKWLFLNFPKIKETIEKQISTSLKFEELYRACTDSYIDTLPKYDVQLIDKEELGIEEFLDDQNVQIMLLKTENTKDVVFRVYNVVRQLERFRDKYSLLSFKDIEHLTQSVDVASAFGSSSIMNDLLIIDFEDIKTFENIKTPIISEFYNKIVNNTKKKIICVAQYLTLSNVNYILREPKEACLADLNGSSLKKILNQKIISSIAGDEFTLNNFMKTEDHAKLLDLLPLKVFFEGFSFLKETKLYSKNDRFGKVLYELCTLEVSKRIKIDAFKNVLENYECSVKPVIGKSFQNVKFVISGRSENPFMNQLQEIYSDQIVFDFSIDQNEGLDHFNDLCRKNPNQTIFKLHMENSEIDTLMWVNVFHPGLFMKRILIISGNLEVNEEELIAKNEKIIMISDDPGTGKSVTLLNIAKNIQNSWVFWINSADAHKYISNDEFTQTELNIAIKFLLRSSCNCSKLAEILLEFSLQSIDSVPVFVFFDAFDEIQETESIRHKVLSMLIYLAQQTTAKIFISTRLYHAKELEQHVGVTSVRLKKIDKEIDKKFCTEFWRLMNLFNVPVSENLEIMNLYSENLWENLNTSLYKYTSLFLNSPLHLKIIAKTFQPDLITKFLPFKYDFNLYDLYSKFVCEMYSRKKKFMLRRPYQYTFMTEFQAGVYFSALNFLIPKAIYYENLKHKQTQEEEKLIPAFAEYFVATYFLEECFLSNKFFDDHDNKYISELLFNEILSEPYCITVRRFINDILKGREEKDHVFYKCGLNWYRIHRCEHDRNHLHFHCIYTVLHTLIEENNLKLIEFIFKSLKYSPYSKKDIFNAQHFDNKFTLILKAVDSNQLEMAFLLLDYKVKLNCKDNRGNTVLHLAAAKENFNSFSITLLKMGIDDKIKNEDGEDLWDIAFKHKNWNLILDTFQLYSDKFLIEKWSALILRATVESNRSDLALKLINTEMKLQFQDTEWKCLFTDYGRWSTIMMLIQIEKVYSSENSDILFQKFILMEDDDIWDYILQFDDINVKEKEKEVTFLHIAVAQNKMYTALKLVERGANLNALDSNKKTPVYLAAENDHWDFIFENVDIIDLKIRGPNHENLLHLACAQNNALAALKVVKKNEEYLNDIDINGRTPLFVAAEKGHWQLISELMALHAINMNICDKKNRTLLHFFCQWNRIDLALFFINRGADFNIQDQNGNTPMLLAAENGCWDLFFKITQLEYSDINQRNKNQETVLHFACYYNKVDLVLKLIKQGADINALDQERNTPAMVAAKQGYFDIIIEVMKIKAIDIYIANDEGKTLLHFVCYNGNVDFALDLIKKGADVNFQDREGNTPALMAAKNRCFELVEELMKLNDLNVNVANNNQKTLLHFVCNWYKVDLPLKLIEKGADINALDQERNTPAMVAAKERHFDIVTELLKNETINITVVNVEGKTLLHFACCHYEVDLALQLIKKGADVNFQDREGNTPALMAAKNRCFEVVEELMKLDNLDVNVVNNNQKTLLHFVCNWYKVDLPLKLIEKGADINVLDQERNTPAMVAAKERYFDIVTELLKNETINITVVNIEGKTLLHFACCHYKVGLALQLIKKGADVNFQDREGNTPALMAAKNRCFEVVEELMKLDNLNVNVANNNQKTLLHFVCNWYKVDLPLKLIKKGADINALDQEQNTPAMVAAKERHFDIVTELLKNETINITVVNVEGKTLLHFACCHYKVDLALQLIKKGADVNFQDGEGNTPTLLAAKNGRFDVVENLMKLDFLDVNVVNNELKTLLHIACYYNKIDLVLEILRKGGNLNVADRNGNTPLLIASENLYWDLVLKLIPLGADLNAKNIHRETILHFACQYNQADIAKILIERGCDLEALDVYGKNPLSIAIRNGHDALVKEISNFSAIKLK